MFFRALLACLSDQGCGVAPLVHQGVNLGCRDALFSSSKDSPTYGLPYYIVKYLVVVIRVGADLGRIAVLSQTQERTAEVVKTIPQEQVIATFHPSTRKTINSQVSVARVVFLSSRRKRLKGSSSVVFFSLRRRVSCLHATGRDTGIVMEFGATVSHTALSDSGFSGILRSTVFSVRRSFSNMALDVLGKSHT